MLIMLCIKMDIYESINPDFKFLNITTSSEKSLPKSHNVYTDGKQKRSVSFYKFEVHTVEKRQGGNIYFIDKTFFIGKCTYFSDVI